LRRATEQGRAAGIRLLQAEQQRDRGRLASAVRAEQCVHFAGADLQIDRIQRQHLAVVPGCADQAC